MLVFPSILRNTKSERLLHFGIKLKVTFNIKKNYFVVKVHIWVIKWVCFGTEKAEKQTFNFVLGFCMKNRLKNSAKI